VVNINLLQMLKHGRAGVPMEVMGLMLGEFVDDYTVQVIDVFAMPQSGTTVSVESVDHVFQTKMVDMLKQTGRYVEQNHTKTSAFNTHLGLKWLSVGITRILDSDVGSQVLISIRSRQAGTFFAK
jgi:hypothetical protein